MYNAQLYAQNSFVLAEFNPENFELGIYHSYKYQTLLLSVVQKESALFECRPNQYFIYQYGKEKLNIVEAGDLKLDSQFQYALFTKIHSLGVMKKNVEWKWEKKAKSIMKKLDIPAQTLEAGKTQNSTQTISCWQQPSLLELARNKSRDYSYLVANFCDSRWCSELYWSGSMEAKFWINIEPTKIHKIILNLKNGKSVFQEISKPFKIKNYTQANAPRENLNSKKEKHNGVIILPKKPKNIIFSWKQGKNKLVVLKITRNSPEKVGLHNSKQKIQTLIKNRKFAIALKTIQFELWKNSDNDPIKFEKLKLYVQIHQLNDFFKSLDHDYNKSGRLKVCQRIHLEPTFRDLWKKQKFIAKFQKICSRI